ncbi:MAG TPA: VOC family protein [Microlunatus sp.]|nr:VOC family protein [Microlunatus sp.]
MPYTVQSYRSADRHHHREEEPIAGEITTPLLPCRSIDEIEDFYRMLGFERRYRQTRPNPYVIVHREDLELQFFGMDGFDPEASYGSCVVLVEDPMELYQSFAAGMRAVHGKVLVSGTPRITRPRRRKNTGGSTGFSVVDPGGNWIRFFRNAAQAAEDAPPEPTGRLAQALQNAIVLGDSKGDPRQAARVLTGALHRHGEAASTTDRVEALVYAAELALRLDDRQRAGELLAEVRAVELTAAERASLAEPLADADDLDQARSAAATVRRS